MGASRIQQAISVGSARRAAQPVEHEVDVEDRVVHSHPGRGAAVRPIGWRLRKDDDLCPPVGFDVHACVALRVEDPVPQGVHRDGEPRVQWRRTRVGGACVCGRDGERRSGVGRGCRPRVARRHARVDCGSAGLLRRDPPLLQAASTANNVGVNWRTRSIVASDSPSYLTSMTHRAWKENLGTTAGPSSSGRGRLACDVGRARVYRVRAAIHGRNNRIDLAKSVLVRGRDGAVAATIQTAS